MEANKEEVEMEMETLEATLEPTELISYDEVREETKEHCA